MIDEKASRDTSDPLDNENSSDTGDQVDSQLNTLSNDATNTPQNANSEVLVTNNSESEPKGVNPKLLLAIGGVFVFILIAIGGLVFFFNSSNRSRVSEDLTLDILTPSPSIASGKGVRVSYLEGRVWKMDNGRWIEVKVEDVLREGDEVSTDEGGRIVLNLDDGSIVRIGESSSVSISKLLSSEIKFILDSGIVFAQVESDPEREFVVLAGDLQVTALGTAFSVENYEDVAVSVYESSVEVSRGGEQIRVEENFEYQNNFETTREIAQANIESDNFLQWSLQEELHRIENQYIAQIVSAIGEDATKEEFKEAVSDLQIDKSELQKEAFRNTTSGSVSSISLSLQKIDAMTAKLSWTSDGLAENGFRIIWSQNPGPTFPARSGDKYTHKDVFGYEKHISIKPGSGTWYFRVCESMGETCNVYSNEASIQF